MSRINLYRVLWAMLLPLVAGCGRVAPRISEAEKERISAEVFAAYERMEEAINRHDVDELYRHYWNDQDLIMAGNGAIHYGWSDMREVSRAIHADPDVQPLLWKAGQKDIRVIGRNAAVLTVAGMLIHTQKDEDAQPARLAATFLMEKIDGVWLVTVEHESAQGIIFQ
jgi:uncharacterized protein (TIGR02246 family)